jgi:hypothetical protein
LPPVASRALGPAGGRGDREGLRRGSPWPGRAAFASVAVLAARARTGLFGRGAASGPCRRLSFLRLLCTPGRAGGPPLPAGRALPALPEASRDLGPARARADQEGPGRGSPWPGRAAFASVAALAARARTGLFGRGAANGPCKRLSFLRLLCTPGRAGGWPSTPSLASRRSSRQGAAVGPGGPRDPTTPDVPVAV